MDRNLQTRAEHLQLFDGGGSIDIGRDQIRPATFLFELFRQLTGCSGLAGSLKTGHHDYDRLPSVKLDLLSGAAKKFNQLFVNDLDNLLPGRETLGNFPTDGLCGDAGNKILGDFEVDISLEQSTANFAECLADVFFRKLAMAAELFENPFKPIG
ncbi:MAG: hypothetical protein ACD_75C02003G0001 [uncultured bacterium]|nr:MAG: hypothetical protein ACD_75C02003G0001 [uncultured bacterium]